MVIMKNGQNERRREVLCYVYNFISLAVMMLIVYAHISGDQLGFVAAGSKERLKEKSRNATFLKTGEEDTHRSLGYTALTNAAGELIFFISHMRDHAFNGTASQKRPAEIYKEAQMVFELALKVIKDLRKKNAAEDCEALSMLVAVGIFAPTAPAPNASVHEEEDDGQTSAAGDTLGSPGGSETSTTSMTYETLQEFREREHVLQEESAIATDDGFILPAAAEVAAAVAGALQRDETEEAGEEAREVIRKAMLLLDVKYNQIKMSMEEGGFGAQCKQDDVLLMKLAASCSSIQQPNDVMKAFAILHAYFCSERLRHLNVTNMRRPAYMDQISLIIREFPPCKPGPFSQ
ncbi:hypothetical protein B484DRAFT_408834 [Ochromonadaceae sp. CCMP2298]|nr:hypothetical protein B484DRAFT_408834 [Ochromonadaceae sp. CCMP2298]